MKIKFKQGIGINQEFLIPKKFSEYLPDNHLAKVIREIVDKLNLSTIEKKYSPLGQHAFDPKEMVSLLFYGYCVGVRSSRKISKGCEDRFDFAFLANGLYPSHDRISDFRKDNIEELKDIFKIIVLIGSNMGLAKLGNINVSIDGAKIKANASSKLSLDEDGLSKLLEDISIEINTLLEEANKIDNEEDIKYGKENRGDELPKKLRSKLSRKKAIEKAYEKLLIQKEEMRKNIEEQYQDNPLVNEQKHIDKMRMNVTDNDANFMKERNGGIKPNYNCQLSVDEKEQFIVANDVTTEVNDFSQLVPMLKKTKENIGRNPKSCKADTGFHSQLDDAKKIFPDTELYINDRNKKNKNLDMEKIKEKYTPVQYENLKRLRTKKGQKEYQKRMYTVEPVIGNIKHNLGYRYFLVRGTENVQGEFNLMCIAHDINKIHSSIIKNKGLPLAVALQNTAKMKGFGVNRWIKKDNFPPW
jgi:transposase